jgi:hypothetical protein
MDWWVVALIIVGIFAADAANRAWRLNRKNDPRH